MPDFSFKKGERLTGKKEISALFLSGRGVTSPPFRLLYLAASGGPYPARTAIAVPKRLYRRAVDRNLLKRRIREAYRLLKPAIYRQLNEKGMKIHLVIQYRHESLLPFESLKEALQKGIEQLMREVSG